ncbi:BQ2448_7714 [Microbotryum intermedium]|uniref:BQ2448_7714 protein n=1 Tax=Microbotryum intermedium TaxID=269621 RepID=A0A238FND0_9BASI|nr:BQ2448_7714 [Microbotryum intermedium]
MYSSGSILREQDELMFDLLSKHRRLRLFEQAVKREPLLKNLSPQLVTHWFESRTLGESSSSSASTSSSSGGSSPSENPDTSLQWQQTHHRDQQYLESTVTYPPHSLPTTTVHYDSGVPAALNRYSPTSAPSGLSQYRRPQTYAVASKHPFHVLHQPTALKYGADEMAIAQRDNWLLQLQQQDQALNAAASRQRELETRRRFELDQSGLLEQDFLSHGLNLRVHRVRIREWLRLNQPQCGEPLEVKLVSTAGGTIITTTVYNNVSTLTHKHQFSSWKAQLTRLTPLHCQQDRYSMHLPLRSLVAFTLGSDSITLQTCERPSFYVTRRATGQSQISADFTTERSASIESQHIFGVLPSELVVVRAQLEQLACSLPLLRVLLFPKPVSSVLQVQTHARTGRTGPLAWASMIGPHLATSKSSPALLGAAGYAQQPGIGSDSSTDAFARPAHQRSVSWTTRTAYEDDCDRAVAIDLARLQAGSRSADPRMDVEHHVEQHQMAGRALPPPFEAASLDGTHGCPVPPPSTSENLKNSSKKLCASSLTAIDRRRGRESTPQCSEPTWDMFATPWSSTAAPTHTISCSPSPPPAAQTMNGQSEVTPRPSSTILGVIGDPASPSPSGPTMNASSTDLSDGPPCFMWNPFEATHCFNIQDWNSGLVSGPNEGISTTPNPEGTDATSASANKFDPNLQAENENLLEYDPNTLHLFTTPPHSDLQLNFGLEDTSSWSW